jgi:hypothetical protein
LHGANPVPQHRHSKGIASRLSSNDRYRLDEINREFDNADEKFAEMEHNARFREWQAKAKKENDARMKADEAKLTADYEKFKKKNPYQHSPGFASRLSELEDVQTSSADAGKIIRELDDLDQQLAEAKEKERITNDAENLEARLKNLTKADKKAEDDALRARYNRLNKGGTKRKRASKRASRRKQQRKK